MTDVSQTPPLYSGSGYLVVLPTSYSQVRGWGWSQTFDGPLQVNTCYYMSLVCLSPSYNPILRFDNFVHLSDFGPGEFDNTMFKPTTLT